MFPYFYSHTAPPTQGLKTTVRQDTLLNTGYEACWEQGCGSKWKVGTRKPAILARRMGLQATTERSAPQIGEDQDQADVK